MRAHTLSAWITALFLASCLFSHSVAVRLTLLLAGTVLCIWVVWKDRAEVRALPSIWLPYALYAAWAALSIAWSADPARSEKEFENEFVYTGIALWTCYVAAQAPAAIRVIPAILSAGAVAVCTIAVYTYHVAAGAYGEGLHGGSGNHSSALVVLMPGALAMAWYAVSQGRPKLAVGAASLASLFCLSAYTTLNRTVWLAFSAEVLVVLALVAATRGRHWKLRNKIAFAVVAAAIPAAALAMTWLVHEERVAEGAPASIEKDARAAIWPQALELVEQRPFTGFGVGRGMLRGTLMKGTGDTLAWHAHNLFLDTVLQTGIPGLALLLLLLGAILREGVRLAGRVEPPAAAYGMALAAVLIGMVVRNMTDVLLVRHNALLFWGVTGVLLGFASSRRGNPATA